MLLCSQNCESGGETFLVDGYHVLKTLDASVVEQLATRPVNQGEADVSALAIAFQAHTCYAYCL